MLEDQIHQHFDRASSVASHRGGAQFDTMGDDFFDKLRQEFGEIDPPRGDAFQKDRPLSLLEKSSKLQAAVAEPKSLFSLKIPGRAGEEC